MITHSHAPLYLCGWSHSLQLPLLALQTLSPTPPCLVPTPSPVDIQRSYFSTDVHNVCQSPSTRQEPFCWLHYFICNLFPLQKDDENSNYGRIVKRMKESIKHTEYPLSECGHLWTVGFLSWLLPGICIPRPLNTELIHFSEMQWVDGCLELNKVFLIVPFSFFPTELFEGEVIFTLLQLGI